MTKRRRTKIIATMGPALDAPGVMEKAIEDNDKRWNFYKQMAAMHYDDGSEEA